MMIQKQDNVQKAQTMPTRRSIWSDQVDVSHLIIDTHHSSCGIFGVYSQVPSNLAQSVYTGLDSLQHSRGRSCGIGVWHDGEMKSQEEMQNLDELFAKVTLGRFPEGTMAAGYVRYAEEYHAQDSSTDREMFESLLTAARRRCISPETALLRTMGELKGAYAAILMVPGKILAARDPEGFRPLCFGRLENGGFVVASESAAIRAVGAEYARELEPGEVVSFSADGVRSYTELCQMAPHKSWILREEM